MHQIECSACLHVEQVGILVHGYFKKHAISTAINTKSIIATPANSESL